jgi:hypothetical protein
MCEPLLPKSVHLISHHLDMPVAFVPQTTTFPFTYPSELFNFPVLNVGDITSSRRNPLWITTSY